MASERMSHSARGKILIRHTLVKLDLKTRTLLSQKPSDGFSTGLQKSQPLISVVIWEAAALPSQRSASFRL